MMERIINSDRMMDGHMCPNVVVLVQVYSQRHLCFPSILTIGYNVSQLTSIRAKCFSSYRIVVPIVKTSHHLKNAVFSHNYREIA